MRVKQKQPQNLDAWDHYLLGLEQFYTFGKDGNEKAQVLFRRAIELDSNFAQPASKCKRWRVPLVTLRWAISWSYSR